MLSLFRINDPYRLILLFIVLLALRMPYWLSPESLTLEEINWLIIGQKLAEGKVMYRDVWESVGPLTSWFYMALSSLFGKSRLALQLVAYILICFQSVLFNNLLFRNKAYNENTYVPALLYGLMMCYFFDMATLSPALLSMTFVLLAINNIYLRIEQKLDDNVILKTGIYLGIAVLFHLPSIAFLLATILAFIFFTGTILRRYLLLLFGFVLPVMLTALHYFYQDSLLFFYHNYILASFIQSHKVYLPSLSLVWILALPALISLIAMLQTLRMPRFTNYQSRVQQVMLLFFAFGILAWLITNKKAPYQFVIFVPTSAFFISHWLLVIRKKLMANLTMLFIFITIILLNHGTYFKFFVSAQYIFTEQLTAQSSLYDSIVRNRRIVVLGDDDSLFKEAALATPFLAWELSSGYFEDLSYYDKLVYINDVFATESPDVIVDIEGVFEELASKIHFLKNNYEAISKQVYVKK